MNKSYHIRSFLFLTLFSVLTAISPALADPKAEDVPVEPLSSAEYLGWDNAFILKNAHLTVVVVPAIGRIIHVGPGMDVNLLRVDDWLKGKLPADVEDWANYGGDWFWPVAQSHWESFQGSDWPPSRLLDGRPWECRGWKNADGTLCCLMTQEYGEPLNLKVSRLIKLRTNSHTIVINQTAERTADSDIPVTLWNISQVAGAQHVIIPVDADSEIDGGVRPMMFGDPPDYALFRCDTMVVYDTYAGDESKLCSDSKRQWIAAKRDGLVIIDRMTYSDMEDHALPDGGCSLEMYSNKGLGYSEIETLSPEIDLETGAILENVLYIEVRALESEFSEPCALADKVSALLKE